MHPCYVAPITNHPKFRGIKEQQAFKPPHLMSLLDSGLFGNRVGILFIFPSVSVLFPLMFDAQPRTSPV